MTKWVLYHQDDDEVLSFKTKEDMIWFVMQATGFYYVRE